MRLQTASPRGVHAGRAHNHRGHKVVEVEAGARLQVWVGADETGTGLMRVAGGGLVLPAKELHAHQREDENRQEHQHEHVAHLPAMATRERVRWQRPQPGPSNVSHGSPVKSSVVKALTKGLHEIW